MPEQFLLTLTIAGAVGAGVVGGVMFAFSTLVMGGIRQLPAAQGIRVMQRINAAAYRPMFLLVLVGTAVLSGFLVVQAVLDLSGPGAAWRLAGSTCYLLTIAITGGFHIPRNKAIDATDPVGSTAEAAWRTYLSEWLPGNHLRTLTAIAGAALLIVATRF